MKPSFFRTTALCVSLAVGTAPALAQPAIAPAAAPAATQGDPPARVGRVAFLQSTVSFHTEGEDHWDPASLNYPVTSGNYFWTEENALAELQVDASALWMNGRTELDLTTLDDRILQATVPQGEVYLHLRNLRPGESYAIQTPRGTITLGADGRYDIVAGSTETPTTVSVLEGSAQIIGTNLSLAVAANQTATITGTESYQGIVGPLTRDPFLDAMLAREKPPATPSVAPPPVVAQMTGSADLAAYGSWSSVPQYGTVWYPQVSSGWVPYREGHWAFVAPWGWTWVDDAPWGFAPFHYGRWVEVDDRWGWIPYASTVPVVQPVYAPALVSFFGLGAAAAVGIGVGFGVGFGLGRGPAFGSGNVGWVPLGPREPYYPPYRVSNTYLRQVNVTNINNVNNISNVTTNTTNRFGDPGAINRFTNSAGATVVPAAAMARSAPVAGAMQRVLPQQLATARPLVDRAPIAPLAATAGVTPAVARGLRLGAVPSGNAPGPSITQGPRNAALALRPPGTGAVRPGGEAAREAPATPAVARPAEAPGPAIHAGEGGRPELRAPNAGPNAAASPAARQEPRSQVEERNAAIAQRPGAPNAGAPNAGAPNAGAPNAGAPTAAAPRAGEPGRPAQAPAPGAAPRAEARPQQAAIAAPHAPAFHQDAAQRAVARPEAPRAPAPAAVRAPSPPREAAQNAAPRQFAPREQAPPRANFQPRPQPQPQQQPRPAPAQHAQPAPAPRPQPQQPHGGHEEHRPGQP